MHMPFLAATLFFIAAAPPQAAKPSEAATPQSLAAGIVAAYRRGGDMTATFTQVYTDSLRHRTRQEAGHRSGALVVRDPGDQRVYF
jgi:hypothetical protein